MFMSPLLDLVFLPEHNTYASLTPLIYTMGLKNDHEPSYSQFACIGTGFSAIGLGATLKRWYNITDIQFFERDGQLGGTWNMNTYPGNYTMAFEQNKAGILTCHLRMRV